MVTTVSHNITCDAIMLIWCLVPSVMYNSFTFPRHIFRLFQRFSVFSGLRIFTAFLFVEFVAPFDIFYFYKYIPIHFLSNWHLTIMNASPIHWYRFRFFFTACRNNFDVWSHYPLKESSFLLSNRNHFAADEIKYLL